MDRISKLIKEIEEYGIKNNVPIMSEDTIEVIKNIITVKSGILRKERDIIVTGSLFRSAGNFNYNICIYLLQEGEDKNAKHLQNINI